MNTHDISETADRWAENSVLKLLGRAFMALFIPVIGGATIWLGTTMWDMSREQARLFGKIELLTERVETTMDDRYRASDANRDFARRDQKDAEQDRRIMRNETRMDRIEAVR